MIRPLIACCLIALLALALPARADAQTASRQAAESQFRQWLETRLWPDAQRNRVSRATFERAFAGVALDWSLPDLLPPGSGRTAPTVQWQAEFQSPARYFSEQNLAALARDGRALIGRWGDTLAAIERRYGVPKEIVVAIWGRESGFGRVAMPKPAIPTLATMAFMGARAEMFHRETIAALMILEAGHIPLAEMRSSLAGALGQPQFLPTSYLRHAVDFDGDGRADIWRSVPDTLASIASYLQQHGWDPAAPWGTEIRLPAQVSCALEGPEQAFPIAEWQRAGITRVDGSAVPGSAREPRHLMLPAGRLGPVFLVSKNFYVIKAYNESDLYALFIGHLADRMRGAGKLAGSWATSAGFRRGDVREMQLRLERMGFDVGGADGLVGFKTRTAIGQWQTRNGAAPTCYPDAALIAAIR